MEECETVGCHGVVFKSHLCLVCANKLFDESSPEPPMTANTEQTEKNEDDGWHVLNCDGCGSPKSVEPEMKQYLCGECSRAYLNRAPAEPTAERGVLVKELGDFLQGKCAPESWSEEAYRLLKRCLSALATEPDTSNASDLAKDWHRLGIGRDELVERLGTTLERPNASITFGALSYILFLEKKLNTPSTERVSIEKKAFWAAFERARMMSDENDIQKHWFEYKALEAASER